MNKQERAKTLARLEEFRSRLEAFLVLRRKMLAGKQLEEKEIESVHELYSYLVPRVGEFAPVIDGPAEPAAADKWSQALATGSNPAVIKALEERIEATEKATASLKADLTAGKTEIRPRRRV